MQPLISDGARITVRQGAADCIEPIHRGDVVLLATAASNIPLIKTVSTMPGDRFAVRDGHLTVNGAVVRNSAGEAYRLPEGRARMLGLYETDYGGVIPPATYLVLGEQSEGTTDSTRFGLVPRDQIIGKVISKFQP